MSLRGRLFVGLQHALPQHSLSRLVLAATRVRTAWFKNLLIRGFLRLYRVDMSEALQPDPLRYGSFNEFFTRAMRPDARRLTAARDAIACPVDGTVSEAGPLERDLLLQAKGHTYRLSDLLAQQPWSNRFVGGSFVTIYLAPFNYHRIHMPARGELAATVYVPGRLFSVNSMTAQRVPRLFARNERVLTLFNGEFGHFALIMVGALNVGSMATVWAGDVTPAAQRRVTVLPERHVLLDQGAEMGRFNMGSTVILLFEADRARLDPAVRAGIAVRLGQSLGTLR